MALAVLGTLAGVAAGGGTHYGWILAAFVAGSAVGYPLAQVPLTAVPQRTALSHAFGGLAAGLVGTGKFVLYYGQGNAAALAPYVVIALVLEVLLGFLTFTGSLMAAGKLQEVRWIPSGRSPTPARTSSTWACWGWRWCWARPWWPIPWPSGRPWPSWWWWRCPWPSGCC